MLAALITAAVLASTRVDLSAFRASAFSSLRAELQSSAATSRVRSLEAQLYDATSAAASMRGQLEALAAELETSR
eukprot:CAMPEP_0119420908 /NCGR_PEP_ID=MMETSP1335-20130426/24620_1 /TAXON_ID=259385 /ORGANISM="Chrysoculter rhomboideus, Strain RCC1486" /LENGTH=74 /DNA_ID=CAMNT_0007446287 /DNA_START=21 /DNA_END=241 /DNA_ORIENTATION=+